MATSTGSSGSSQTTSSVAAASTTTNAAVSGLEGYSTGLMAGVMFLAARLFL
jgi:hypothetical protein